VLDVGCRSSGITRPIFKEQMGSWELGAGQGDDRLYSLVRFSLGTALLGIEGLWLGYGD